MTDASIWLKAVNDLLTASFVIPAYQRGYRWTELQVRELLEDVLAFQRSEQGRSLNGFYCLQPIVVKAADTPDAWEVVDGQQRLTTLFLILRFFNERLTANYRRKLYSITYATRPESREYLLNPTSEKADQYIDFFFIFRAKETIANWFSDKDNLVNDFEAALLNRVKIIWYQLPAADKAVDAFTRLNVGKIALTNSELVRALFLRSTNFPQATANLKQVKIAQEWDSIEKALRDESFWYFLTDDRDSPNRIELVFDLIRTTPSASASTIDQYSSFHRFSGLLDADTPPDDLWDDVKRTFMSLEEWFRDDHLFHLIGFLVNERMGLREIMSMSSHAAKHEFHNAVKDRIFETVFVAASLVNGPDQLKSYLDETLEGLRYGSDSHQIRSILLLFNIVSIIAHPRSVVRFRFDFFKNESWDIEHIRSVDSARPTSNADKRLWLETVRDYFEDSSPQVALRERALQMLATRSYTTDDAFDILYDAVLVHFNERESLEAEDGIGNLALLDSGMNRGYRNAVFPIKRKRLLRHDQAGVFVPLCTRNAFLKCYSTSTDHMFAWTPKDQVDYRRAISGALTTFFASHAGPGT